MNKITKSAITLGLGLLGYATPQVSFAQTIDSTAVAAPVKKLTNREKRQQAFATRVAEDKADVICTVEKLMYKTSSTGDSVTYSPVKKDLVITNQYLTMNPELLTDKKGRAYKGPPIVSNLVFNLYEKTITRLVHQGRNHIVTGKITEDEFTPECKKLFAAAAKTDMSAPKVRMTSAHRVGLN